MDWKTSSTATDKAVAKLRDSVRRYSEHSANADGVAFTRVPGFRIMRFNRPMGPVRSLYKPLVCLVLQGSKTLAAGRDERTVSAGETVIVGAHLPVTGQVFEASLIAPYLAIAIELDLALLHELAIETGEMFIADKVANPVFSESLDETIVTCASRLMRLVDHPKAIESIRPGIMRELHYWLLMSKNGPALRKLALPNGEAQRITCAIDLLRKEYREHVSAERLADAANLSPSAFRRHFKQLTSLSPVQFQKQLRLTEARRLMMAEGYSASLAADSVGYQSASHFSRDFVRMFGAPPRQDRANRTGTDSVLVDRSQSSLRSTAT